MTAKDNPQLVIKSFWGSSKYPTMFMLALNGEYGILFCFSWSPSCNGDKYPPIQEKTTLCNERENMSTQIFVSGPFFHPSWKEEFESVKIYTMALNYISELKVKIISNRLDWMMILFPSILLLKNPFPLEFHIKG